MKILFIDSNDLHAFCLDQYSIASDWQLTMVDLADLWYTESFNTGEKDMVTNGKALRMNCVYKD